MTCILKDSMDSKHGQLQPEKWSMLKTWKWLKKLRRNHNLPGDIHETLVWNQYWRWLRWPPWPQAKHTAASPRTGRLQRRHETSNFCRDDLLGNSESTMCKLSEVLDKENSVTKRLPIGRQKRIKYLSLISRSWRFLFESPKPSEWFKTSHRFW